MRARTAVKSSPDSTERPDLVLKTRTRLSQEVKTVALLISAIILAPLGFSLVQYIRYGFELFLGWDTSTYVWWTKIVYLDGPFSPIFQGYPNLYVLTLAAFGALIGNASMAERVLPFLVTVPLSFAYYLLTLQISGNKRLGYLGALLAGITVNTLRLYSDLHRNMLSFSISMLLGADISSHLTATPFSWRLKRKRALVLWLPMLALVAYTQIETYVLLSMTLILVFARASNARTASVGAFLVAAPVIVVLPLIWPLFWNYGAGLSLLGISSTPAIILGEAAIFLGGFAFPWMIVGLVSCVKKARLGNAGARFVVLWLLSTTLLFPIALIFGLPISRLLYVVPVPLLTVTGIPPSIGITSRMAKILSPRRFSVLPAKAIGVRSYAVPTITMALVLTATLLTSVSTADLFLRPYVSSVDVDRLLEAAKIVRSLGYDQPILIMYGQTAADVNPIYRAYFGIELPRSLAYYGKLQYVFSLPSPEGVYNWQYNPPFEQASNLRYRSEILNRLGTNSAVTSHAIIVAGSRTYDRPLSEPFITRFEQAPGIYLIPPNALTPSEIDSWRLFAYSDWANTTSSTYANVTWSVAPTVLSWVAKGAKSQFAANFTISLAQSWGTMEMALRFYDWTQPYIFPDTSTVYLAPIEIYFDGTLIRSHSYSGLGPSIVSSTIFNVASGVHKITVKSGSPGLGVAVALDEIQVCPFRCS